MGIRSRINARRVHYAKLGKDGPKFLNQRRSAAEGEVISIGVNGYKNTFHLRNKTSDIATFYQCIFNAEYDIKIDFEPKVIVDLGANIGLTSTFFKKRFPQAKIIAVEPESSNFEIMQKNTAGLDNVSLHQAGVWSKSAHLLVEDKGYGHYGFTVKEVEANTSTLR